MRLRAYLFQYFYNTKTPHHVFYNQKKLHIKNKKAKNTKTYKNLQKLKIHYNICITKPEVETTKTKATFLHIIFYIKTIYITTTIIFTNNTYIHQNNVYNEHNIRFLHIFTPQHKPLYTHQEFYFSVPYQDT